VTEAFAVGQTVRALGAREGEIVYGPVTSTFNTYSGYVVTVDGSDRWYKASDLEAIPETPTFAIGDEVTHRTYGPGVVAFGPFKHTTGPDHYLMVDEGGCHILSSPDALKAVEPEPLKVGDRVRVVRDDIVNDTGKYVGKVGVLRSIDRGRLKYLVRFGDGQAAHGDVDNGHWFCEAVERVEDENTYTHDGVTYSLTGAYRDSDGDEWRFRRINGVVRAAAYGCEPDEDSQRADSALSRWAPFARI
jgi:hypothetical protein